MSAINPATHGEGLTLRQAALIAGVAYFLMPVTFAEFYVFPKLFIAGDIEQTVRNITSNGSLLVVGILCHLVTLILDVVIAWALYVLLIPVNKALSLLTAWFRVVYVAVGLFGLLNLVTVFRLLNTPYYLTIFGDQQLHAQVQLLINSFRYDFLMGLGIFGIHLALLGYLVFRSGYVPKILGVLPFVLGVGWIAYCLKPYLYPNINLGLAPLAGFGELLLPLWLLIRGWKIQEPARSN